MRTSRRPRRGDAGVGVGVDPRPRGGECPVVQRCREAPWQAAVHGEPHRKASSGLLEGGCRVKEAHQPCFLEQWLSALVTLTGQAAAAEEGPQVGVEVGPLEIMHKCTPLAPLHPRRPARCRFARTYTRGGPTFMIAFLPALLEEDMRNHHKCTPLAPLHPRKPARCRFARPYTLWGGTSSREIETSNKSLNFLGAAGTLSVCPQQFLLRVVCLTPPVACE